PSLMSPRIFLTVISATTTTLVSCTPAVLNLNEPSNCIATVAGVDPTETTPPTGSVIFSVLSSGGSFTQTSCDLIAIPSYQASCSATYTPSSSGPQTITSSYGGDAFYSASVGTFALDVAFIETSTSITCAQASVPINQGVFCQATVTDTSTFPLAPTGTISFTTNSTGDFSPASICALTPSGNRAASCSFSYTSTLIGNAWITASYAGDSIHTGSLYSSIISITPAPELSAPSFVIARVGSVVTFRVSATDADTT